jgi:transcriptional regulator with XRE-family HTH domain
VDELFQRLGQRIRDIRIQRGFASQEALADYLKVHRTFVGHLETGRKDFRLTTLVRIAEALGVPLADLFIGLESGQALKPKRGAIASARNQLALLREIEVMERSVQKLKVLADDKQ